MIPTNSNKDKGTLIGIDYGSTNIGLSIGRNGFVSPLEVVSGKNVETSIHEIIRVGIESNVSKFIVGLPLDASGQETKQSLEVRKFVKILKIMSKKPVEFQNEFNSSNEAMKEAIASGMSKKRRKISDNISAAIILKHYYEEHGFDFGSL